MTALDTDTLTETIEALDFEPEEPCDNWDWGHGCKNSGTWLATHTCCGDTYPLCGPCVEALKEFLKGGSNKCKACGAPDMTYPGCITFTPLKKS